MRQTLLWVVTFQACREGWEEAGCAGVAGGRFPAEERSCADALKQENMLCLWNWGRLYGDKHCSAKGKGL